jgi:hypothetical protein
MFLCVQVLATNRRDGGDLMVGQRWSAKTDRVLREVGWHPGREVSTSEWEAALQERGGFEIHDAARRFLAEFGDLHRARRGAGVDQRQSRLQP